MARVTTRRRRLPTFRTDEEERAFWETDRPGDYVATMPPERVQVSRRLRERVRERKKNLTLKMEPSRVREIKAVARERGVDTSRTRCYYYPLHYFSCWKKRVILKVG